jgi:hypothetical protein
MEYYSAIRKNEGIIFAGKWIELEIIMLCGINRAQKSQILHVFAHMQNLELK